MYRAVITLLNWFHCLENLLRWTYIISTQYNNKRIKDDDDDGGDNGIGATAQRGERYIERGENPEEKNRSTCIQQ